MLEKLAADIKTAALIKLHGKGLTGLSLKDRLAKAFDSRRQARNDLIINSLAAERDRARRRIADRISISQQVYDWPRYRRKEISETLARPIYTPLPVDIDRFNRRATGYNLSLPPSWSDINMNVPPPSNPIPPGQANDLWW